MEAEKKQVQDGYDKIAEAYLEWALQQPYRRIEYLEELMGKLPADSHVLELGCGAGSPVLEKLTNMEKISKVTGNDISEKQVQLAKSRCPQATLIQGDMTRLEFAPSSFDAVIAFFSIIHLPRIEHPAMLSLINSWLKPGGFALFNLATQDEAGIQQNFFGAPMFWSSYKVETSKEMIEDAGFELVKADVRGSGEDVDPSDPDYEIEFLWIIARKLGGT